MGSGLQQHVFESHQHLFESGYYFFVKRYVYLLGQSGEPYFLRFTRSCPSNSLA